MATPKKSAGKKAVKSSVQFMGVAPVVVPGYAGTSPYLYLVFGTLFGYFLSKARATDYDTIVDMFMMRDFQLYGVIGVAILVTSLGLYQIRGGNLTTRSGEPLKMDRLDWEPKRLTGAFLFGSGWALTGTCPGTCLAQIGEGKLVAFATAFGILAGVWYYRKVKPLPPSKDDVC